MMVIGGLDLISLGVLLVDAAGQVLFASRAAEALLDREHGLRLDAERLSAADPTTAAALRRLIARCAGFKRDGGWSGGSIEIPRGAGRARLHLLVAPCGGQAARQMLGLARGCPAALVLISDPERERAQRRERLRARLGLTPAEAGVAMEIIQGDGRNAAAARLGVATTTVRTHLSHIFEKAGVRRQAELVSVLLQSEHDVGDG